MKKSLIAVAVMAAFANAAQADDQLPAVQVYGILDAGVVQMTHAGNFSNFVTGAVPTGSNAPTGTVRGMVNGGESQTRLGFKGSEDLGDGYKAFFQMESAFSLANGQLGTSGLAGGKGSPNMVADTSLNGQLFNRNAFIGLSGDGMGAISFGRQNSLQLDIITAVAGGYDPVNAQMFSPINFSGSYGGGGATDDARVDSSIKYANKFGNVNVNVLYGMGGVAGATSARANFQANVGYEQDVFGLQAAMQHANDTTAISANAAPGTVNAQFENLESYMLAAHLKPVDAVTLKAGYEQIKISAPGNYGVDSQMTTIYGYNIGAGGNTEFSPNSATKKINVYWIGANIQVAEATKVSLGYYAVNTPEFVKDVTTGATTPSAGDHYLSALLDYNLSKKTNFYAGVMLDTKAGNGLYATTATPIKTYNTYGAGLRIKF